LPDFPCLPIQNELDFLRTPMAHGGGVLLNDGRNFRWEFPTGIVVVFSPIGKWVAWGSDALLVQKLPVSGYVSEFSVSFKTLGQPHWHFRKMGVCLK
jgi:hypothetical protein